MSAQTLQLILPDGLIHSVAQRVAELLQQPADGRGGAPVEPWLGVTEAARYLACPVSRIYDLVSLGRLTPHRDGRRLLFRPADLDAALAQ
jgi:excisionase family DNA binding protein